MKLHPQGGSVTRNVSGESLCGSAETIPVPVPCDDDGMFSRASRMEGGRRDERGSNCAGKGVVEAGRFGGGGGFPVWPDAARNGRGVGWEKTTPELRYRPNSV